MSREALEYAWAEARFDLAPWWSCPGIAEPLDAYSIYHSEYIKEIAATGRRYWGWNTTELDVIVDKLRAMTPEDPAILEVYKEALEIWMKNLPTIPVCTWPLAKGYSTAYWKGWPTTENLYAPPHPAFGAFLFVTLKLTRGATGLEARIEETIEKVNALTLTVEDLKRSIATISSYVTISIAVAVIAIVIAIVPMIYKPKRT